MMLHKTDWVVLLEHRISSVNRVVLMAVIGCKACLKIFLGRATGMTSCTALVETVVFEKIFLGLFPQSLVFLLG
jgi:hypothetical protein